MTGFVLSLDFGSPGYYCYGQEWWFNLEHTEGEDCRRWHFCVLGLSLTLRIYRNESPD